MHEMSLVQALLAQLDALALEHNKTRVVSVTVDIGPLSGVAIDSFEFAFTVLAAENSLTQAAKLIILSPPATYICTACHHPHQGPTRPEQCERCQETLLLAQGGDAIVLNQVELE